MVNGEQEYVVIHNQGGNSVNMAGFTLEEDSDYWTPHYFPTGFSLDGNANVTVHTGKDADNATDLYWGRDKSIWNDDGNTAYLYDNGGGLVDSYSY